MDLKFDREKYVPVVIDLANTVQIFITNKCNRRCKACFYEHMLGKEHMPLADYKGYVQQYLPEIKKVTLMGGEPTLHPDFEEILRHNQILGLRTTIYTNGSVLHKFDHLKNLEGIKFRIGVMGLDESEKPLRDCKTTLPVEIVYMLRADNVHELLATANYASEFNCKVFFISSIRDIADTGDFWVDNEGTLPVEEYFKVVQDFVSNYQGDLDLHLSTRSVINTPNPPIPHCRFLNIFPNGQKVICPFEISLMKTVGDYKMNTRPCRVNPHGDCLFQKLILKNRSRR